MPELPEVEAARRAIEENCIGKKIVKAVVANDPKVIDGVSSPDFEAALVGKTIVSALRKGKNMWLVLDSPPFPSFQFGMAGAIYIKGVAITKYKRSAVKDTDDWPSKYSKLFIELDDGLELSFTDKRRFARVRLLKDPASVPPISELGPDALLEPIPVGELHRLLSKKNMPIKALLLDQSFVSGIGNWIADEVLYQARIHPLQIASSLSRECCTTLHKCISEVIEHAIEVGANSSQFPNNWIFHSREKKPGEAFVDGKEINFITAGGRTTAFVPELQKLSGNQAGKAVGKPKTKTSKRKRDRKEDDNDEDGAIEPANKEEEIAQKSKSRRELKPRGRGKRPPGNRRSNVSDDHNEDGANAPASEEEESTETAKPKRELKTRGHGKYPPANRKSKASDDDNEGSANERASEEEENTEKAKSNRELKTRGRAKNPPANRKFKASDDDSMGDNEDDDDDVAANDDDVYDQRKKPRNVTNKKQAKEENASNKSVDNLKAKKPKRKV